MATYLIDAVDGTVLTDPFGSVLYDSGGSGGNYGANESFSVTINPGGSYLTLKLDYVIEFFVDFLTIRNGTSVADPVVWQSTGLSASDVIIPSSLLTSGSAHVTFTSDASVELDGFELTWRDLKLSPVAYYNMENGTGSTVTDQSIVGNAIDGTLSDAGMWNPSAPASSNSLYFAASSDKVTIPKSALTDFDSTDEFSIACWINMPYASSWKIILSNDGKPLGNLWYRGYIFALNNGRPYWMLNHQWNSLGKCVGRYGLTNVADGTWRNLVVTYDGGRVITSLKIYVDGVEETYGGHYPPNAYGLNAGMTIISPDDLIIGEGFDGLFELSTAYVDEMSIWNFELSQEEVTELYDSGTPLDLAPGGGGGGGGSRVRHHRTSVNNLKLKL